MGLECQEGLVIPSEEVLGGVGFLIRVVPEQVQSVCFLSIYSCTAISSKLLPDCSNGGRGRSAMGVQNGRYRDSAAFVSSCSVDVDPGVMRESRHWTWMTRS